MNPQDPWRSPTLKPGLSWNASSLRNTWIRPHDQLERVCKAIRERAMEVEEKLNRCQRSAENTGGEAPDGEISHRAEEQQKQTSALSLTTQCEENKLQFQPDIIVLRPYLLGRRHPHVAEPAHVLRPKPNEKAGKGNISLEKYMEHKKRSFENIGAPSCDIATQSAALVLPFTRGKKLQPPVTNPPCPEDPTPYLPERSTSQFNTSAVGREEVKANNPLPPRVSGADGVGVNSRSWASVAKAGMKHQLPPRRKPDLVPLSR